MRPDKLAVPLVLGLFAILFAIPSPTLAELDRNRTTTFISRTTPLRQLPLRKAQVCHLVSGGLEAELIVVEESLLPLHLAHGDFAPVGDQCVVELAVCGGIAPLPCPEGSSCWDLPNDGCGPGCCDCLGFCGRVVPLRCSPSGDCPAGLECFDDPDDDCNPDCGDVGCPTACATAMPFTCAAGRPGACHGGRCADELGDGSAAPCDSAWTGRCVIVQGQPCGGYTGLHCDADATCAMDLAEPPAYAGQCVIPLRQ